MMNEQIQSQRDRFPTTKMLQKLGGAMCGVFFPAITARTLSYLLKTKVTSDLTDLRINMQNRLEYVFETAISTSKSQFGSY